MNNPLVSIIIPCFNAAPWLSQTLESALSQTWPRVEVVVVDDGSTDGSADIARRYGDSRLKLVQGSHHGACAARNFGYSKAQGNYIQFLDADDLISPDKIAAQIALLRESPRHSLATCRWLRFRGEPATAVFADQPVFRDLAPIEFLLLVASETTMMHPAAFLTPRDVAEAAGPWNENLPSNPNDDGEYFSRVVLASSGLRFAVAGTSYYRVHAPSSFSLSRRRDETSLRSRLRTIELITARMLATEDSPRVRQACADLYQRLVYSIYPRCRDVRQTAQEHIRTLGGSVARPHMGRWGRALATLIGWKGVGWLRYWLRG
ncbi:MAG: glycosyltransferase family A protein [Pseudomonadota bacterium]